jgi:hypothetical protein
MKMSYPLGHEQQQCCPRFTQGLLCWEKKCHFDHHWSVYHAVKEEKLRLAKLHDNHGDGRSEKFIQKRDTKVVQVPSAGEKKHPQPVPEKHPQPMPEKHQQPLIDAPSSKFPRRPRAKKVCKEVTHAQTTKPVGDALKAVKAMEAALLGNSLPNISSCQQPDGPATESKVLYSFSLRQKVENCMSRNMATVSIKEYQDSSKWPKVSNDRSNSAMILGPKITGDGDNPTTGNHLSREECSVKYVLNDTLYTAPSLMLLLAHHLVVRRCSARDRQRPEIPKFSYASLTCHLRYEQQFGSLPRAQLCTIRASARNKYLIIKARSF